jgi:hypothetical protein
LRFLPGADTRNNIQTKHENKRISEKRKQRKEKKREERSKSVNRSLDGTDKQKRLLQSRFFIIKNF